MAPLTLPITDNDAIAAVLATELGCDLAIILSEVDGVYPSMDDPTPILSLTGESLQKADSEIVMVDLAFWDDLFEQDRSWDDSGTTIARI